MNEIYLGILRHILTMVGAYLVTHGVMSDGQAQIIVGAVVAVAPVVWSIVQKRQQKAAVITAAETGVPKQATITSPVTPNQEKS